VLDRYSVNTTSFGKATRILNDLEISKHIKRTRKSSVEDEVIRNNTIDK